MLRDWPYNFELPQGDFGTDESAVSAGYLPVLTGVDGRFRGQLRRFPGFRRLRQVATGGATIDFFKYAEVQKGTTRYKLRGFVVRYGTTVVFDYYDTEDDAWCDTPLTVDASSTGEIDVTYGRRFLYYAKIGTTGKTFYNDGSDWVNTDYGYIAYPSDIGTVTLARDLTNGGIVYTEASLAANVWVGYRLGHMSRGLWTPLTTAVGSALASGLSLVIGETYRATSGAITITEAERELYDTIEVYRTIDSGGRLYREIQLNAAAETGVDGAVLGDLKVYDSGGTGWQSATAWRDAAGGEDLKFYLGFGYADGSFAASEDGKMMIGGGVQAAGRATDAVLSNVDPDVEYDWTNDPALPVPEGGRICYFDGVIIKSREGSEDDDTIGEIQWTDTARMRPETFPINNWYPLPRISDTIERFIIAGDAVFGVASSRLYRFQPVAGEMAVQLLQHGMGLLNRWSVVAMGESLAILGPDSLSLINSANGAVTNISALETVLQDTNLWGAAKSNVFLAYDSFSATLYMCNPDLEEALTIWGRTNTIGKLADVRFSAATSGPHPETGGVDRAFFITPSGWILYPDLDRENATRTMMGIPNNRPVAVNGTFATTVSAQTVVPLTAFGFVENPGEFNTDFSDEFNIATDQPEDWTDAVVYVFHYSGNVLSTITRHVVTGYDSAGFQIQLDTAMTVAPGDRWSVSPVVFEVAGWPIGTPLSPYTTEVRDLFSRKRLQTIGFSLDVLGGAAESTYRLMFPQVYASVRDGAITTLPTVQPVAISESTDLTFGKVNVSGPMLLPGLKCYTSDLDFKVRAMLATGEVEPSRNN